VTFLIGLGSLIAGMLAAKMVLFMMKSAAAPKTSAKKEE
jgi:hypothetical protein